MIPQSLGVDAQYTLFEALHDNYPLCKAVDASMCASITKVITSKGFDPSYLLPLSAAMKPLSQPVRRIQKLVLKSVLDPYTMHGLFQRRQIDAGGKSVVVAELVVRLVMALGINPEVLVSGAGGPAHAGATAVVLGKPPAPLTKSGSVVVEKSESFVATSSVCTLLAFASAGMAR
jgi:hypothetical protein